MGRGLSPMQLKVIDTISNSEDGCVILDELRTAIYGADVKLSNKRSLWRCLNRLKKRGLIRNDVSENRRWWMLA